ncbi:hypothetical protein I3843_13G051600 [Carya illinoinensis]|uniref:Uncharacterized protein n=1 Tax=Carya illinoinensis TaxID=32201 RepID=A0A8T1NGP3_CARIL|nr:uncharacterized protein LOC122292308 [Carya illinoinensis]KAG6631006.1 hypothetical protein CIPAW_13G060500 [Carya illinoinensis]KAG7949236.1 hypothetical protein I3843_13G051600 [Carya illinoinensis]KAG7949237.1 hypothetical protein I3843_13G051600 [Carya illinoinensis]
MLFRMRGFAELDCADEMRIEQTSLVMVVSLLCVLGWLPLLNAQLPGISARSLDAILQDYAFGAIAVRPKTGLPYDARLPSNLSGIAVSAMRLRSGSLRTRGVTSYKEFQIPIGVLEQPYVERLVLVYQNLGNWSSSFYPLPGFSYLAPVLGLLAYNGTDLSASNLPELDITASSHKPILIKFLNLSSSPDGLSPKCVFFDLHGSVQFDNMLSGDACSATQQGHFSVVVESPAPSPAPSGGEVPPPATAAGKRKSTVWIVLASLGGGLVLLAMLALLFKWLRRRIQGKKVQQMEWAADRGQTLQTKTIGNSKAPFAMGTRTRPVLENEYVP